MNSNPTEDFTSYMSRLAQQFAKKKEFNNYVQMIVDASWAYNTRKLVSASPPPPQSVTLPMPLTIDIPDTSIVTPTCPESPSNILVMADYDDNKSTIERRYILRSTVSKHGKEKVSTPPSQSDEEDDSDIQPQQPLSLFTGLLRSFGYKIRKPESERRRALIDAIGTHGRNKIIQRLNGIATANESNRDFWNIIRSDVDYIKRVKLLR